MDLSTGGQKLGVRSAPLFFQFAKWIADDCQKKNIYKLYFFAREGIFFRKIFSALIDSGAIEITHELLEVSRLSTFLPSLDINNPSDWNRILNQYGNSTVSALISSLCLAPEEVAPFFLRYGLSMDSILSNHPRQCAECFMDVGFVEYVGQCLRKNKKNLKEYLREKGITAQEKRIAVVDIGWRGTIQDNLCYLYPNTEFMGYYFGLISFLNEQPKNAKKVGFLNELPYAKVYLKSHTQLEMICSAPIGSVTGYEIQNGEVSACMEDGACDENNFGLYAAHFQQGVLNQIVHIDLKETSKISSMRSIIESLTIWPDIYMARAFSNFCYSERFGLGDMVDQRTRFQWKQFTKKVFAASNIIVGLRQALNDTQWPQGFLCCHHLGVLIPMYNLLLDIICRLGKEEKTCECKLKEDSKAY